MDVKKWVYNFNELDPDNQLKVAIGIQQELQDNESYLDQEDGYDSKQSQEVRKFFEKLIAHEKNEKKLRHFMQQIQLFDTFSPDNKSAFIVEIMSLIRQFTEKQAHDEKEEICLKEGHTFGHWRHRTWTSTLRGYPEKKDLWERTCSRCDYCQMSETEPKSLRDSRRRTERKEYIKSLKAELDQLEGHKKR